MTRVQLVARIAELEAQLAAANAKIEVARACYIELKGKATQPRWADRGSGKIVGAMYFIATVIIFAGIGVMLAWRG